MASAIASVFHRACTVPIIPGDGAGDAPLAAAPLPFAASPRSARARRCYGSNMRTLLIVATSLVVLTFAAGRAASEPAKPPAVTTAQIMDRQLSMLEKEFVPAAQAMPESKYDFAPTAGEFKGVRTFALEVKHVAHTNFVFFAALLGDKLPADVDPKEENGPAALRGKAEIVKYLERSFAMGHRAMATVSDKTLTERIAVGDGMMWSRLASANLTLWHSYDHYGQMVEYLRMNGIVPPASRNQK
jgi:hypothetical protein